MQNLEEAYKKAMQEEVPDLWARIEDKLPEKKKKKKIISITRYMGLAAAALFLCVLIPGVISITRGAKTADSAANEREEVAYDAAYDAEYNADYEMQYSGMADSGAGEDGASTAGTFEEKAEQSAPAEAEPESLKESTAEDMTANNTMQDAETVMDENMFDAAAPVGAEHINVSLTVEEIVQYDGYKVLVLSAEDGNLCKAYMEEEVKENLFVGEKYEFMLQKQEGEDWDYAVLAVE